MKRLLILLLAAAALTKVPMLSHGNSGNCYDECNDYYCPPEHQLEKKEKEKEKVKNIIPSRK